MRKMEFTIENNGHALTIGSEVNVIESKLPTSYYYTIEHALGMSTNFTNGDRLKTTVGKVLEIKATPRFNIAVLEFNE